MSQLTVKLTKILLVNAITIIARCTVLHLTTGHWLCVTLKYTASHKLCEGTTNVLVTHKTHVAARACCIFMYFSGIHRTVFSIVLLFDDFSVYWTQITLTTILLSHLICVIHSPLQMSNDYKRSRKYYLSAGKLLFVQY